jgi:hypothetical protein
VTSLTDDGVGKITVTWSTAFSSTGYAVGGMIVEDVGGWVTAFAALATGSTQFSTRSSAGALADSDFAVWAFGDQ